MLTVNPALQSAGFFYLTFFLLLVMIWANLWEDAMLGKSLRNGADIGVEAVRLLNAEGGWDTLKLARQHLKEAELKGSDVVKHLRFPGLSAKVARAMADLAIALHTDLHKLQHGGKFKISVE